MRRGLFTGMVLLGLLSGCASSNNEPVMETVEESSTSTSVRQGIENAQQSSESQATVSPANLPVSLTEAIAAYQETYPDSDITSIDLDDFFGNYSYQIEGVDDTNEYEIRVDGETKAVTKERVEALDEDERNGIQRAEEKVDLTDLLSLSEVAKIAEKEVEGTARSWELEQDDGVTYWEVTVRNDRDMKVKMHAQTGAVLEIERD